MNCQEFDTQLQQTLDDRRAPRDDERLAAHARICPVCEEVLASYETLLHGARRLTVPAPSARLAERAVEQFSAAGAVSPARPARFQATHWAALATAAAVVLVMAGLAGRQLRRGPREEGAVAQSIPAADGNAATPANRRTVATVNPGGNLRRPENKSSNLTGAQEPIVVVPAPSDKQPGQVSPELDNYRTTISLWAQQWPVTVEKIDAFEHYAPGIRPIRASFSAALDALRRTLPGSSEANSAVPQARGEMGEMSVA